MPPDDLDRAISLLIEQGMTPSLGISARAAAEAAGITRTTVYRHWESVDQLNDDLAWAIVQAEAGWHRRLLDAPPDADLGAALAKAVRQPGHEWGALIRAAVTPWAEHAAAPGHIAAWEEAMLEGLARWLTASVAAQGRVWTSADGAQQCARTATALVEGGYLIEAYLRVEGSLRLDAETAELLGAAVAHLVAAHTAAPAAGAVVHEPDLEPSDRLGDRTATDPEPSTGAEAALRRIVDDLLAQELGSAALVAPSRIVDASRLARRLDLSERTLYERWPTTSSFNAALAERTVVNLRAGIDLLFHDTMDTVLLHDASELAAVLLGPLDQGIRLGSEVVGRSLFVAAVALADPAVRTITGSFIEVWRTAVRTSYLAWLALTSARVRPPITPLRYGDLHMMAVLGSWRMACTHPRLLEQTRAVAGRPAPVLAADLHDLSIATSQPVA